MFLGLGEYDGLVFCSVCGKVARTSCVYGFLLCYFDVFWVSGVLEVGCWIVVSDAPQCSRENLHLRVNKILMKLFDVDVSDCRECASEEACFGGVVEFALREDAVVLEWEDMISFCDECED